MKAGFESYGSFVSPDVLLVFTVFFFLSLTLLLSVRDLFLRENYLYHEK